MMINPYNASSIPANYSTKFQNPAFGLKVEYKKFEKDGEAGIANGLRSLYKGNTYARDKITDLERKKGVKVKIEPRSNGLNGENVDIEVNIHPKEHIPGKTSVDVNLYGGWEFNQKSPYLFHHYVLDLLNKKPDKTEKN